MDCLGGNLGWKSGHPLVLLLSLAQKRVSIQSTAVSTAVSTAAFEQLLGPAVNARLNSCWGPLLTRVNTSGSTLLAQLGEHCLNVNPWCLIWKPGGEVHEKRRESGCDCC